MEGGIELLRGDHTPLHTVHPLILEIPLCFLSDFKEHIQSDCLLSTPSYDFNKFVS